MIAGTLEIQMLANMAQLTADMGKAKGIVGDTVKSIESMLGAIGVGFSATMLLDKINSVADGMDKLRLSSEKTGASVEALSQLQFFAGVSGSGLDSLTGALVKLGKADGLCERCRTRNEGASIPGLVRKGLGRKLEGALRYVHRNRAKTLRLRRRRG